MTRRKPLPEILPQRNLQGNPCLAVPELERTSVKRSSICSLWYVLYQWKDSSWGEGAQIGPYRMTKRGAVIAWNKGLEK